ncbi:MAG: acetyl-CoA carboxylase biotin carboxyl carrier protein [Lachnospiraceae bacterium]|nr:acetyl-CoA carboxylase biotin carboxyl carrier protein [Lachnospiraceae bacterium]
MNTANIKNYAKIMKEMELTALEISDADGTTIRLERMVQQVTAPVVQQPAQGASVIAPATANVAATEASVKAAPATSTASATDVIANLIPVTSPMVGVFYTSPSENAAPYVSVGDRVKKGDVLCIIESMKLMNEITAEEDGIIEEVCVSNGQVVDFGHVIFRMSKA